MSSVQTRNYRIIDPKTPCPINIRTAGISDQNDWDEFVHGHSAAAPYHLYPWNQAINQSYGFRVFNLIAEKDNRIQGILPLSLIKLPFSDGILVALPYCDVGAALANNDEIQRELVARAISIGQQHNTSSIDIRGDLSPSALESIAYPAVESCNKVRMLLSLPGSSEELWNSFKSKLRSQIRKAEKNRLTFSWGNDQLDKFYHVFSINMRDLGSPTHSKKWFQQIISSFGDRARVGLIFHQDIAIGAGIMLQVGNKVSIPWASTLREYNSLGPNMLLYWNLLKHASDTGCRVFDFGRSTPNEGTYKFKAQWGAKPAELNWYRIFLKGSPPPQEALSVSQKREYAEKTWQKLPLTLTNFLGPFIRKYISL